MSPIEIRTGDKQRKLRLGPGRYKILSVEDNKKDNKEDCVIVTRTDTQPVNNEGWKVIHTDFEDEEWKPIQEFVIDKDHKRGSFKVNGVIVEAKYIEK